MSKRAFTLFTLAALVSAAACGGDKPKDEPEREPGTISPVEFKKQQARYADSVISNSKTAKDVISKMAGKDWSVGSVRMRDSLALLTDKSKCYAQGRASDPYLSGTVSFFMFMSVVGSNAVRVQEAQWTSPAGNIVVACLNLAAKDWKFDTTFGKAGTSYITQVTIKSDSVTTTNAPVKADSAASKSKTDAKATKKAPAGIKG